MTTKAIRDAANGPWEATVGQRYDLQGFGVAEVVRVIGGKTAEVKRDDGSTIYVYASVLGSPIAPQVPSV